MELRALTFLSRRYSAVRLTTRLHEHWLCSREPSSAPRRIAVGLIALASIVILADGCSDLLFDAVCEMRLEPKSVTLSVNGVAGLTATPVDCRGARVSGWTANFVSADTTIARVDANGRVTAVRVGATTVAAVANGKTASATVTVAQ